MFPGRPVMESVPPPIDVLFLALLLSLTCFPLIIPIPCIAWSHDSFLPFFPRFNLYRFFGCPSRCVYKHMISFRFFSHNHTLIFGPFFPFCCRYVRFIIKMQTLDQAGINLRLRAKPLTEGSWETDPHPPGRSKPLATHNKFLHSPQAR